MKQYMEKRILLIAHYTIDHNSTVRSTAKKFGISKSTVHKDLTERLPQIDHHLAGEVREVLEINKQERHIRGGQATKEKYLQKQHSHFNNKHSRTSAGGHHNEAFFSIRQKDCNDKSRCG